MNPTPRRLLVTWCALGRGGAENSTTELCEELAGRYSCCVKLLVLAKEDVGDLAVAKTVDVQVVHTLSDYLFALVEYGRAGIDHLVSNHRTYPFDLEALAPFGVHTIVVFRQTPLEGRSIRVPADKWPSWTWRAWDDFPWTRLSEVNTVVAVSHFTADHVRRYTATSSVRVIHNGVRCTQYDPRSRSANNTRFCVVGRLVDWKRLDVVLGAFAEAMRLGIHGTLTIIGDGPEANHLHRLTSAMRLEELVTFTGFSPQPKHAFQSSDFLIHACDIESFGRVIAEAGACGVPSIAPQCGGPAEIVDRTCGMPFDTNSTESLRNAIIAAAQIGLADYTRMSENVIRRVREQFSIEACASAYAELLQLNVGIVEDKLEYNAIR
jgi:glycosyltransferase involved in cell wall biosynthesis